MDDSKEILEQSRIKRFSLNLFFPFVIETSHAQKGKKNFSDNFLELSPGPFWEPIPEEEMHKNEIDRFFFPEVADLYCSHRPQGVLRNGQLSVPVAYTASQIGQPKLRFFRYNQRLNDKYVLSLYSKPNKSKSCTALDRQWINVHGIWQGAMEMQLMLSMSRMAFIILTLSPKNIQNLDTARGLLYSSQYPRVVGKRLVLLNKQKVGRLQKDDSGEYPAQEVPVEAIVPLHPQRLPEKKTVAAHDVSLPDRLVKEISVNLQKHVGKNSFLSTCRGTIPIASHLLLDGERRLSPSQQAYVAKYFPPGAEYFDPYADQKDSRQEDGLFVSLQVNANQWFYLSPQGFMSIGYAVTQFDNQWHDKFRKQYLQCYLLVLHQSVLFQELSRISYLFACQGKPNERERRYEAVYQDFISGITLFDFNRVSNHLNTEKMYQAARRALQVERAIQEVRDELTLVLGYQERDESKSLNAMALVVLLLSMGAMFINLNVSVFNRDARIPLLPTLDNLNCLWLWIPLALSLSILGWRHRILWRVIRYIKNYI